MATEDEDLSASDIGFCTTPIVQLKSDVLETEPLSIITGDTYVDSLLTTLPVCSSLYLLIYFRMEFKFSNIFLLYYSCIA